MWVMSDSILFLNSKILDKYKSLTLNGWETSTHDYLVKIRKKQRQKTAAVFVWKVSCLFISP
jgi:hypothetical protein